MRKFHGIPIDVSHNDTLALKELLKTLIGQGTSRINEHFRPITDLCELEHIHYDYIAFG
jgi:hypothetical protein